MLKSNSGVAKVTTAMPLTTGAVRLRPLTWKVTMPSDMAKPAGLVTWATTVSIWTSPGYVFWTATIWVVVGKPETPGGSAGGPGGPTGGGGGGGGGDGGTCDSKAPTSTVPPV